LHQQHIPELQQEIGDASRIAGGREISEQKQW
jgi:hypothetical protein